MSVRVCSAFLILVSLFCHFLFLISAILFWMYVLVCYGTVCVESFPFFGIFVCVCFCSLLDFVDMCLLCLLWLKCWYNAWPFGTRIVHLVVIVPSVCQYSRCSWFPGRYGICWRVFCTDSSRCGVLFFFMAPLVMVNITGRWLEESSSIVLIVCMCDMFDRNMSMFDGMHLGCFGVIFNSYSVSVSSYVIPYLVLSVEVASS